MTDSTTVRHAMATLSRRHRAVIYRAYYLKRTTAQIAEEYRISEAAVRAELHAALQELLRRLRNVHAPV